MNEKVGVEEKKEVKIVRLDLTEHQAMLVCDAINLLVSTFAHKFNSASIESIANAIAQASLGFKVYGRNGTIRRSFA